jgi:hypothetical protein
MGLAGVVALAAACSATRGGQTFGGDAIPAAAGEGGAGGAASGAPPGSGDDGQLGGAFGVGAGGGSGTIVCNHPPDEDGDHDGWTGAQGDCNDCDPNVNPGAIDAVQQGGSAPGVVADNDCSGKAELPGTCDEGLAVDDVDPWSAARAVDLCQRATKEDRRWGVLDARWVRASGDPEPPGQQAGLLAGFGPNVHVQKGATMLALSSGHARLPGQPGACVGTNCKERVQGHPPAGVPQDVPNCQGDKAINDDVGFEVVLRAPTNATGYEFMFKFQSFEFPQWVCTRYNDQFIALVSPPPEGSINGNVSFDSKSNPVSVNMAFFDVCDPGGSGQFGAFCRQLMQGNPCPSTPVPYCPRGGQELAGTGFDDGFGTGSPPGGATRWLQTAAPVHGGDEVTIRFAIWDTGDQNLDSTVLVDGFHWVANGGTVAIGTKPVPTPK